MSDAGNCSDISGRVAPVVDRNRCEGKGDCVVVCPYQVFEVSLLAPEHKAGMSLMGKLKAWAHGGKQAFVVKPMDCHACKSCVSACPEQALKLVPFPPA